MGLLDSSVANSQSLCIFIKPLIDSAKQRTRLRQKIAKERAQLSLLLEKYNTAISGSDERPLTIDTVMTGDQPHGMDQSDGK